MRKVKITVCALIFALIVPITSFASTDNVEPLNSVNLSQRNNTAENEVTPTKDFTRTIEIERSFREPAIIPNSIYYSSGGWSGTLYAKRFRTEGTITVVTYVGNVSCSGACPID